MEVVYRALENPGLAVALPHDHEKDQKNHKGDYLIGRNINFEKFFLKLDSKNPIHAKMIKILDDHPGNAENIGKAPNPEGKFTPSFEKIKTDMAEMIAVNEGRTFAAMPEHGLLKEDIEKLQYLVKLKANMPPNTRAKAVKTIQEVFVRFSIAGIAKVTNDTKPKVIYARALDALETLEERGIWKDGDTEGEGHSEQSTEKD